MPGEKKQCTHYSFARTDVPRTPEGCRECLRIGSSWVHLRLCLTCGEVACCNESPNRHASKHAAKEGHPLARSFEPGEDWVWCYRDEVYASRIRVRAAMDEARRIADTGP